MKVIIAGGRNFNDYNKLCQVCDANLKNYDNIEIICGGALGADSLGEKYANEKGYTKKYFYPDWNDIKDKPKNQIGYTKNGKPYWKLAGFVRNEKMAKYGNILIVFWDGKSNGTENMIKNAIKNNLIVKIHQYENV